MVESDDGAVKGFVPISKMAVVSFEWSDTEVAGVPAKPFVDVLVGLYHPRVNSASADSLWPEDVVSCSGLTEGSLGIVPRIIAVEQYIGACLKLGKTLPW